MRRLLKRLMDESGQGAICYGTPPIALILTFAIPITVCILRWKDPILLYQLGKWFDLHQGLLHHLLFGSILGICFCIARIFPLVWFINRTSGKQDDANCEEKGTAE